MRQPQAVNCSGVVTGPQDKQHAGGQDHAQRHADLRVGAEVAALAGRGVFHGHQRRAAPFAAGGEALDDAQQHQQQRGEMPICA